MCSPAEATAKFHQMFNTFAFENRNVPNANEMKELLEQKADPNKRFVDRRYQPTPLHIATKCKWHDIARLLLEYNADSNALEIPGPSSLTIATITNQQMLMRLLIEHRADVNQRDSSRYTPWTKALQDPSTCSFETLTILKEAGGTSQDDYLYEIRLLLDLITKGQLDEAEALANAEREHWPASEGKGALHIAAQWGACDLLSFLIDHGFNINEVDQHGNTPLHRAIEEDKTDAALLLLDKGADPAAANNRQETPLWLAATNLTILQKLLTYPVDINAQSEGVTPFFRALDYGIEPCWKLLKEKGADITLGMTPKNCETPLHIATKENHSEDLVREIIALKGDVNAIARNNRTPLDWAARYRNTAVCGVLLDAKADPNLPDDEGYAPLHTAARLGLVGIGKLLLESGANLNAQTLKKQYTPLHLAASFNKDLFAAFLLQNDANPYARDSDGELPSQLTSTADKARKMLMETEERLL